MHQEIRACKIVDLPGGADPGLAPIEREVRTMSDDIHSQHKLADAIDPSAAAAPALNAMPGPSQAGASDEPRQQGLAAENEQAHHNQGGLRERLVEDGKANHMAGRGNGRRSDQSG